MAMFGQNPMMQRLGMPQQQRPQQMNRGPQMRNPMNPGMSGGMSPSMGMQNKMIPNMGGGQSQLPNRLPQQQGGMTGGATTPYYMGGSLLDQMRNSTGQNPNRGGMVNDDPSQFNRGGPTTNQGMEENPYRRQTRNPYAPGYDAGTGGYRGPGQGQIFGSPQGGGFLDPNRANPYRGPMQGNDMGPGGITGRPYSPPVQQNPNAEAPEEVPGVEEQMNPQMQNLMQQYGTQRNPMQGGPSNLTSRFPGARNFTGGGNINQPQY